MGKNFNYKKTRTMFILRSDEMEGMMINYARIPILLFRERFYGNLYSALPIMFQDWVQLFTSNSEKLLIVLISSMLHLLSNACFNKLLITFECEY